MSGRQPKGDQVLVVQSSVLHDPFVCQFLKEFKCPIVDIAIRNDTAAGRKRGLPRTKTQCLGVKCGSGTPQRTQSRNISEILWPVHSKYPELIARETWKGSLFNICLYHSNIDVVTVDRDPQIVRKITLIQVKKLLGYGPCRIKTFTDVGAWRERTCCDGVLSQKLSARSAAIPRSAIPCFAKCNALIVCSGA